MQHRNINTSFEVLWSTDSTDQITEGTSMTAPSRDAVGCGLLCGESFFFVNLFAVSTFMDGTRMLLIGTQGRLPSLTRNTRKYENSKYEIISTTQKKMRNEKIRNTKTFVFRFDRGKRDLVFEFSYFSYFSLTMEDPHRGKTQKKRKNSNNDFDFFGAAPTGLPLEIQNSNNLREPGLSFLSPTV